MKRAFGLILILFILPGLSFSQGTDPDHERWEYVLVSTGDVLQYALPATAGIITVLKKDKEGSKQLLYSYATTLTISYSLKYFIKKQRPEGRQDFNSFPSGHTAGAFSGASFIHRRYKKYAIPAYALAALVAISRTEGPDGFHDYWDVLGGAAIGIGSTYLFTKPHKKVSTEVSFISNEDLKMVTIKLTF